MPQASDELRNEFGIDPSGALEIIDKVGGTIKDGYITLPDGLVMPEEDMKKLMRACEFLIDEWDYAMASWEDDDYGMEALDQ